MEITVEIKPAGGSWKTAEEIIKKVCEAHKEDALRIEVKDVKCVDCFSILKTVERAISMRRHCTSKDGIAKRFSRLRGRLGLMLTRGECGDGLSTSCIAGVLGRETHGRDMLRQCATA